MLQKLHEKVQGWLAWVVVGLVASTFALFGVSYYANSRSSSNVKATVNGQAISRYDFDSVYRRLKQQSTTLNASTQALLKAQALEQVILDAVMQQAGEKNNFYISSKQVEENIVNNDDFKENGVFASQRFQQLLSNNMFSQSDYLKVMTNGLMNNQVRFSFIATSFVLQNELKRYIEFENQKRNYDYIVINPRKLAINVKPSEGQLTQYYNSHKDLYKTDETISLEYVLLSMSDELKKIKLSQSDVKDFYKENKSSYMSPARFQIKRIFLQGQLTAEAKPSAELQKKLDQVAIALKTQTFDKVSETYSDDLFSDKATTPWVMLSMLDKGVARALTNLPLDTVSGPVFTQKGVEYIKVIAKQEAKLTPFDKVKAGIEKSLRADKAQYNFQQKAEQLADLSYQNPDDLKSVAEPLELVVMQTPLSSKSQGFKAPLDNKNVMSAAFSHDVLQEHNNSQPIQLNDDALIVLRVKQHEKSALKPIESVRAEIIEHLIADAQRTKARNLAKELSAPSLSSDKITLENNNLSWRSVNNGLRTPLDKTLALVNDFAFELTLAKGHNIHYKPLDSGNIAIVKLKEIIEGKLSDVSAEQRTLLENQLASKYGIKTYDLYVQALKKQAKINVIQ